VSPLAKLQGQLAPQWSAAEWSRTPGPILSELRGRPVLLCFYRNELDVPTRLPALFGYARRCAERGVAMIVIHATNPDGVAGVERAVRTWIDKGALNRDSNPERTGWPFAFGVDEPMRPPGTDLRGNALGQTAARYGFLDAEDVLINADGRVAATSEDGPDAVRDALESLPRR
jgi:hypothetical protein